MPKATVSLVLYKSSVSEVETLLHTLGQDDSVSDWVVVDNGAAEDPILAGQLRSMVEGFGGKYLASERNVGFGAGHNAGLKFLRDSPSEFHLIVNPDIIFGEDVLPALVRAMAMQPRVGLIMPKVLYPDGRIQHLCKLLPTPFDFILRRFAPNTLQKLLRKWAERFELRMIDPDQPAEIPYLSGCFMFVRRSLLESLGGFDERYFLYMEDLDLCREFSKISALSYWPEVSVKHVHQRGSHKSIKLMRIHIQTAISYFNKWGWFFDKNRREINRRVLARTSRI